MVEDYFRKSVEFRTWLSEEVSEQTHTLRPVADGVGTTVLYNIVDSCVVYVQRKKFFSDLTSQESHSLFKDFVKEWNDQLLHKVSLYYYMYLGLLLLFFIISPSLSLLFHPPSSLYLLLLLKKYYRGLQSAALEHGKQTGHVWKVCVM